MSPQAGGDSRMSSNGRRSYELGSDSSDEGDQRSSVACKWMPCGPTSDTREKNGEVRRRGKRNVLARNRHRHGYPFKGRSSNRQDRRRSRSSVDGTGKKASTGRASTRSGKRWKRCVSRSHVSSVGNDT